MKVSKIVFHVKMHDDGIVITSQPYYCRRDPPYASIIAMYHFLIY